MPMFTPITPTRVRSPLIPDTGNLALCMKSRPASILKVPGGMMSTSSVMSGRGCAAAVPQRAPKSTTANQTCMLNKLKGFIDGGDCNVRRTDRQRIYSYEYGVGLVFVPFCGE